VYLRIFYYYTHSFIHSFALAALFTCVMTCPEYKVGSDVDHLSPHSEQFTHAICLIHPDIVRPFTPLFVALGLLSY
jgi:hypothetical protein